MGTSPATYTNTNVVRHVTMETHTPKKHTICSSLCTNTAIDITVREYCGSLQGLYQHPHTPIYNYICKHASSLVSLAVCQLNTNKHTRCRLHNILSSLLCVSKANSRAITIAQYLLRTPEYLQNGSLLTGSITITSTNVTRPL